MQGKLGWGLVGRCHWTVEAQVTLGATGPKNNGQPNCKAHRTEVIKHWTDDEALSLSKLETLNPIAKLIGLTQQQVYWDN